MSTTVTPQYLLEGAVYALEQCGLLLRDAKLLYQSGSYASAVVLAAFAQEALGQWRILLDLRSKVLGGERRTIEQIRKACGDHVRKQTAGTLGIITRASKDSVLDELYQSRVNAKPGSKEQKAAIEGIEKLDRQRRKRTPDKRHEQRKSALYVDAVSPDRWNRPGKEISRTDASFVLQDATNDYSMAFERYTKLEEFTKKIDRELYSGLAQWAGRPQLPPPEQII